MEDSIKDFYNVISYDVDNTIYNSELINREAITVLAAKAGCFIEKGDWAFLGGNSEAIIYDILSNNHIGLSSMYGNRLNFSSKCIELQKTELAGLQSIADVGKIMSLSSEFDIAQAFFSNSCMDIINSRLDYLNIDTSIFVSKVSSEQVEAQGKRVKPEPDGLFIVMDECNNALGSSFLPRDMLYIGDSHKDVEAAIRFGADVIQISGEFPPYEEETLRILSENVKSKLGYVGSYRFLEKDCSFEYYESCLRQGRRIKPSYPSV